MVMVASLNGKITQGTNSNIYEWTSKEDQEFFFSLIKENNLIVMGSNTYNSVREKIKLDQKKLRIVLTQTPDKYKKEIVRDQLEFSSEIPRDLVSRLSKKYKQMLLVGGGEINAAFLNERLIDEIYLTIEPVLFGIGKNLLAESEVETELKLVSSIQLNKSGTVLLKYKIIK